MRSLKNRVLEHDAKGIDLIKAERKRQIEVEEWTPERDKQYHKAELFHAASCYYAAERSRAINNGADYSPEGWPWSSEWWKPSPDNRVRELEKAGALYMAHQDLTGQDCSKWIRLCADEIDKIKS